MFPERRGSKKSRRPRSIFSGVSPWEKFLGGDDNALSLEAKIGLQLFNGRANCNSCHMGWTLSDYANYDLGLKSKDKGRGLVTKQEWDMNKFRNSPLLDIGHRAP